MRRKEVSEDLLGFEREQCQSCKRIGCWTRDEEDKKYAICKCGELKEI